MSKDNVDLVSADKAVKKSGEPASELPVIKGDVEQRLGNVDWFLDQ